MLARPEPRTKEHIVLWLSSKTGEYNWYNSTICACAQYWAEYGGGQQGGWSLLYQPKPEEDRKDPLSWLNWLAFGCHTFEELYKRARADLYGTSA
jgi:hypothetical protein